MTMKRLLTGLVGVLALLAVAAFAVVWQPGIDEVEARDVAVADRAQIARGYELAQLGNCESCHTAEGGAPYAGGRPLDTPFGTIHAVNISPDRETGIGTWSEAAFARAMRKGVDRTGAYLYPAFPYTHFTKMSEADIGALYAYLRSIPAVNHEPPANSLPFPFNIRALMAGWNLLFLDEGHVAPVAGQSEEWNRGRYLVDGVTHCGACHTPRNVVGAERSSAVLAGAEIDGWFAPPLDGAGARAWTQPQMAAYLATGFSRAHGAAAGPMGETVTNLARVAPADIAAIATYVSSLTEGGKDGDKEGGGVPVTIVDNDVPGDLAATHDLWVGACAGCHEPTGATGAIGAAGQGGMNPSYGIVLSTGYAVQSGKPLNVVRTIIGGVDAYRDIGGPYMPAFGGSLTGDQIADLTRYVRARFSNGGAWTDVAGAVQTALGEGGEEDGQGMGQ